jgi:hypothetical protein
MERKTMLTCSAGTDYADEFLSRTSNPAQEPLDRVRPPDMWFPGHDQAVPAE